MRIVDSTSLGDATAVQTGRAGALHSIDSGGKTGSTLRNGSSALDSVELSGFAGRLSQTMEATSASRAQRVAELTAAVRSGSYQVDASAVSHAMVSQAISSGSIGKL
jgi:flagellar biosynthesis anti-sigma factor FlgM